MATRITSVVIILSLYSHLINVNNAEDCCKADNGKAVCNTAKDPESCFKITNCVWDCDGGLVDNLVTASGNERALYLSVEKVSYDPPIYNDDGEEPSVGSKKVKGSKPKWKHAADKFDASYTYYEAVIHSNTLRIDPHGVVYRAKTNPKAYFTDDEIKWAETELAVIAKQRKIWNEIKANHGKAETIKTKTAEIEKIIENEQKSQVPTTNNWMLQEIQTKIVDFLKTHSLTNQGKAVIRKRLLVNESNYEINERRRLAWAAGDWGNRPNNNAPWTSIGMLEWQHNANNYKEGVGTVIYHSRDAAGARQRYDWVLTAGHNCYKFDVAAHPAADPSTMKMALNYHNTNNPSDDPMDVNEGNGQTHGKPTVPGVNPTLFVNEYIENAGGQHNFEYQYDWCLIKFPIGNNNAPKVPIHYDTRNNQGYKLNDDIRLYMATYYIDDQLDTEYRQVYMKSNTEPRRKKLTFKVKNKLFVSKQAEFTIQGTSGSPWFKSGDLTKQVGIHVGSAPINRGGTTRDIVNRITKALFHKILKISGMGKNERNDGKAGTSTTLPAANAMYNEYGDYIDEIDEINEIDEIAEGEYEEAKEEKYGDYYNNYYIGDDKEHNGYHDNKHNYHHDEYDVGNEINNKLTHMGYEQNVYGTYLVLLFSFLFILCSIIASLAGFGSGCVGSYVIAKNCEASTRGFGIN